MAVPAANPMVYTLEQCAVAPVDRFLRSLDDPSCTLAMLPELVADITIEDEKLLEAARLAVASFLYAPTNFSEADRRTERHSRGFVVSAGAPSTAEALRNMTHTHAVICDIKKKALDTGTRRAFLSKALEVAGEVAKCPETKVTEMLASSIARVLELEASRDDVGDIMGLAGL
ncbi:hypothetical protein FRC11_006265 [Ceratobasidium sp. 423]|nr:hypothetical protein FRC11_006265 [Ceratobasidium sp. 423]